MRLAALCVVFLAAPVGSAPTDVWLETNSYAFGKVYSTRVTRGALDQAPGWKDNADDPPLPARKAIRAAEKLKDKVSKLDDGWKWVFASANLRQAYDDRWYWLIQFEADKEGVGLDGAPIRLNLVVLMDGTAVEPTVADEKPKR